VTKQCNITKIKISKALLFTRILIMKPTRCTNFSNLFWNKTLHVPTVSLSINRSFSL